MPPFRRTLNDIARKTRLLRNDRFAWSNFERDLDAVILRLESGEYRDTDFALRNVFDIPRRTREFFRYFEGYLRQARTWQALLSTLPLEEITSVLDLCPGWGPKVELGLHYLGYQGTVTIYDLDSHAAKALAGFLSFFEPGFKLRTVSRDLFASKKPKARLVVGNHLFDDLLLYRYCRSRKLELADLYAEEDRFRAATDAMLAESREIIASASDVARALDGFVAKDGYLLLTHYPGLYERCLKLDRWSALVAKVFKGVERELLEKGYRDVSAGMRKRVRGTRGRYFSPRHFLALHKR